MFWDDQEGGNMRVLGAVDDGGWRAFVPLCEDFIKTPSGNAESAPGTFPEAERD